MSKLTEREQFVIWFNGYLLDPNIGEVENRVKCNAAWEAWQARALPIIDSADEFLAKRLGRVAKLADVPMPDNMDYKQIAECAGTILGQIARNLEMAQKESTASAVPGCFKRLFNNATGMSFGTDWNNGTHANAYREKLLAAVEECKVYMKTSPTPPAKSEPALQKGFMTAQSGQGGYQIVIKFKSLKEMQEAHAELIGAVGSTKSDKSEPGK